jgi:hypothetical protein
VVKRHGVRLPGATRKVTYEGVPGNLLTDAAFQDRLLQQAERLEPLLPHMPLLRHSGVVRVRLVDMGLVAPALVPFAPLSPPHSIPQPELGTIVRLPRKADASQIAITLLATLACPPIAGSQRRWHALLTAFQRVTWQRRMEAAADRGKCLQLVTPAHLTMDLDSATKLVNASLQAVTLRLGAVQVLQPAVQALANNNSINASKAGSHWSLAEEIRRVLANERRRGASYARRYGHSYKSPYPTGKEKTAIKNFETRIIGPARPVLHLALGFAFAMEMLERDHGRQEAQGSPSGAAPDPRIRFDWWRLVDRQPGYADLALRLASQLEPFVRRLPVGGPDHRGLVSLCADEALAPSD